MLDLSISLARKGTALLAKCWTDPGESNADNALHPYPQHHIRAIEYKIAQFENRK